MVTNPISQFLSEGSIKGVGLGGGLKSARDNQEAELVGMRTALMEMGYNLETATALTSKILSDTDKHIYKNI